MKRWVIADTHWGHKKLIEEKLRPADYEARIFDRWLQMIRYEDMVIHLGDVMLPDTNKDTWSRLWSLPGVKILVRGNHDKRSTSWYMERGFAFACDAFELGGILFTHEPRVNVPEYVNYNVHGHLHAGVHREFESGPKHRLVSLEESGYAPVSVEKLVRQSRSPVTPSIDLLKGLHPADGYLELSADGFELDSPTTEE